MATTIASQVIFLMVATVMMLFGNPAAGREFAGPDSCLVMGCKLHGSTLGCICYTDQLEFRFYDWAMLVHAFALPSSFLAESASCVASPTWLSRSSTSLDVHEIQIQVLTQFVCRT